MWLNIVVLFLKNWSEGISLPQAVDQRRKACLAARLFHALWFMRRVSALSSHHTRPRGPEPTTTRTEHSAISLTINGARNTRRQTTRNRLSREGVSASAQQHTKHIKLENPNPNPNHNHYTTTFYINAPNCFSKSLSYLQLH